MWNALCFFLNDTATPEIYTLSLHDALPISAHGAAPASALRSLARRGRGRDPTGAQRRARHVQRPAARARAPTRDAAAAAAEDRKSTRLNSSHANISYAVFCLKKKTKISMPD